MPPTKRGRSKSPVPPSSSNKKAATSTPSRRGRPSTNSPKKTLNNKDWKKWKQQQIHDYNTHQFLDASATVSAGLFGARRLPEVKSLWRQMVQGEFNALNKSGSVTIGNSADGRHTDKEGIRRAGEGGGGKISSRHLRRRTNSHRRRRRHRFPRGNDDVSSGDAAAAKDVEDGNIVTDGNADMPEAVDDSIKKSSEGGNQQKKKACRRARRKPALMTVSHSNWWHPQTHSQLVQSGKSMVQSNDETVGTHNKWIPTHLWHAKRFHVSPPLFSWSVPLLHSNRGSRASLRLASSETTPKCTIQDGTWEIGGCAIRLEVNRSDASSQQIQQPIQILISIMQRVCGPDAPFLNEQSILEGQRASDGLMHDIDACPLRPIGPATFTFGCSNNGDECESAHVSILVHPAIHQRIVSLLDDILPTDADMNEKVTLSTVPFALLRIRGRAAASTLHAVLKLAKGELNEDANHGTLYEIEMPTSMAMAQKKGSNAVPDPVADQSPILIKAHKPNQNYQHLPHNLASSGWDILCHPSISSSLFQDFVNNGGACPIGLAEDARAHLEAYPPLPIFPRDFPDTEEGKSYWAGSTDAAPVKEEHGDNEEQPLSTWKDWVVIRACIEGSWGRMNTPLKRTICHWKQHDNLEKKTARKDKTSAQEDDPTGLKLVAKGPLFGRDVALVCWASLISPDAGSTIVVRGSFGIPFLQLFHGCGRLAQPTSNSAETKHRRPRRKVCPPTSIVTASPLSSNESEAHSNLCQQLKASLSLPAMLRCELHCDGKGALNIGDLIFPLTLYDYDDDISQGSNVENGDTNADEKPISSPLGVVVAGGFSPSRGKCNGIGFVGAAKLLDALDGSVQGMGVTIPQSNGQKKMTLKVMVARDASRAGCVRFALLSLLL